jgi:hypothetical protein
MPWATLEYINKNNDLRREADEIILTVWNEVETHFAKMPEGDKRKECEVYGLIYFFRKGELNTSGAVETQSSVLQE